jgi:hypothetical protein
MKKLYLFNLFLMILAVMLLCLPSMSNAFSVTYLDPQYNAVDFLTLDFSTNAIAFDADGNLYASDRINDGTGTAEILKLDAATDYTTSSVYMSYATTARNINGLDFNNAGSLFVSEANAGSDSGLIREIDTASLSVINTISLPDFRPTGIAADLDGNIFFPGRLNSDPGFGNLYQIDQFGVLGIIEPDFVGTGIELDASGSLFASTPRRDVSPLESMSIYTDSSIPTQPLLATFDDNAEELTFDLQNNLYVLGNKNATDPQEIIRLSVVPEPISSTLFIVGGATLGFRQWRKKRRNI